MREGTQKCYNVRMLFFKQRIALRRVWRAIALWYEREVMTDLDD